MSFVHAFGNLLKENRFFAYLTKSLKFYLHYYHLINTYFTQFQEKKKK